MSQPQPAQLIIRQIVTNLRASWRWWVVPTVVCTTLALVYALTRTPDWLASQALVVRDEASGGDARQGRFEDIESMKTAQETIHEISRNASVIAAALAEVGPPADASDATRWPTTRDTQDTLSAISVTPPNGAEFGKTEVIYLNVEDKDRRRAVALATAICNQIDRRLAQLRDHRAQSVIAELEKSLIRVRRDHERATQRLAALESSVGSDLGELRILNDTAAGDSNLRSSLNEIKNELRQDQAEQEVDQQQFEILIAAQAEPDTLLATPNQLLESQPALRRLKDGLVDAQLDSSQLLGRMSADHPHVLAAASEENLIRQQLHRELAIAIRGLQSDIRVRAALIESRQAQLADVNHRLERLAALRARYGNLLAEKKHYADVLEQIQRNLADAQASQSSAQSTSLLTRLDGPETGDLPLGPGKKVIVAAGLFGGLSLGLGLVFLVSPTGQRHGRRLTDVFGRRFTDRVWGRRATDVEHAPTAGSRRAEDAAPQRSGDASRPARRASDPAPAAGNTSAGRRASDIAPEPVAAGTAVAEAEPERPEATGDRRAGDRRR